MQDGEKLLQLLPRCRSDNFEERVRVTGLVRVVVPKYNPYMQRAVHDQAAKAHALVQLYPVRRRVAPRRFFFGLIHMMLNVRPGAEPLGC